MTIAQTSLANGYSFDTGASNAAVEANNTVLSADFNTFLQMLTTQMTNQDPLNPIDSSEYASQLATFSSVEQQVVTNDLLESMISLMGPTGLSEYSGWIGREVRSSAPVYFEGDPISVEVSPASGVDSSVLEIYDSSGSIVRSIELTSNDEIVHWDGATDQGFAAPVGEYTMLVDNLIDGESIGLSAVYSYQEVSEIRSESGQIVVVLAGGAMLPTNAVNAIRG